MHKAQILLIVPAGLRKQWSPELANKLSLPSTTPDSKGYTDAHKLGKLLPFDVADQIVITSCESAATEAGRNRPYELGTVRP